MALTQITEKGIKDGEIINADINASAAIALSKLDTSGTANNGTFLRGDGAWTAVSTDLLADTSPQLGGDLDTNSHHILIDDDHEIKFGASNDLRMFHVANNANFIQSYNNNHLRIQGFNLAQVKLQTNESQDNVVCKPNGATELYHSGTKKFETSANGVTISGNPTINGNTNANGHITLPDHTGSQDGKLRLGTSNDLQLYHDGNNSRIEDTGTGYLAIRSNNIRFENPAANQAMLYIQENGGVDLYHANTRRFRTLDTGAAVTGGLSIDGSGVNNASGQDAALHVTTDVNDWAAIFQKSTEYGVKIDSPNGATLAFALYNGATQKLAIAGDGKITATNNLAFASGKGIDFSATSNASGTGATMSNELLDHYEEGSWTPTWTPASGSFTALYYSGSYTRVGNVVTCIAAMSINGSSNPSGEVKIGGLPFTVQSINSSWDEKSGGGIGRWLYSGPNHYSFLITTTNEDLRVFKADGAYLNSSNLSTGYNTSQFSFVITYITDA